MKGVLIAALVVSVGANVLLLATRGGSDRAPSSGSTASAKMAHDASDRSGAAASGRHGDDAAQATEVQDLQARIAALEKDLAVAREKAADAEGLDPLALIMDSRKPMAWRMRKLLEVEPEKDRLMAAWKLGQALGEKEDSARQILDALKTESDPKILGLLGEVLRAGAAGKASPEDRRAFADLLRTGSTAELRLACVRGVFMNQGFRGGFDEKTKALAQEMNGVLVAALRSETSPEVVGGIARSFADWFPTPEAVDALREAAARLPSGQGRRSVWEAIARGTFMGDQGASLFQQFQQATDQEVRDDIAAGLARAGNSMGGPMGGTPEHAARRVEEARSHFFPVYQGTSDPTVRRSLLRAALYGLGCMGRGGSPDDLKEDASRFFRQVAAMEPDATQKARLEQVAAAFESNGMGAYQDFDRIMSGKE